MKTIKKEVRKFKQENHISKAPNVNELMDIIHRKYGFTTYGYHRDEEKLHETKTYEISLERPAFSYSKNGKRYVFYNDTLSDNDIRLLLAHELGHLHYDHLHRRLNSSDTPIYKEWQAHVFAGYLLYSEDRYSCVRKIMLAIIIGVACFSLGTFSAKPAEQNQIPLSEDYVYITPSGHSYHAENCQYGKDYRNSFVVRRSDAEEHFLPCDQCNPDKYK